MPESTPAMDTNGPVSKEPDQKKDGVKYLEERCSKGDRKISESEEDRSDQDNNYTEYPLVSIQVFDKDDKPEKKRLRINSQHICDALAKSVRFSPDQPAGYEPPVEIESPFAVLHHHLADLWDECNSTTVEEEKKHFNFLFRYLEKEPGSAAAELVKNGLITFKLLWAIFKPGEYLHTVEAGGQSQILWLQRGSEDKEWRTGRVYFGLDCLCTASNGTIVGKTRKQAKVYQDEFPGNGVQQITSLSAFPLEFLDGQGLALKQKIGERAIEYNTLESEKPAVRRYRGVFEVFDEDTGFGSGWEPHTTVGRVLIDTKAFLEENPSQKITVTPWGEDRKGASDLSEADRLRTAKEKDSSGDRDMLSPPYVYGYCLSMRRWGRFFLGNFEEPGWDENQWTKHLILPPTQKDLLHSMVSSHLFPSETEIHEEETLKGKGLVIVLHGPPGTGKTLTAVSIAEKTHKPLLLYPAGELGSNLDTIQSSVKKIIRQASRWKAILLIDEADVFLESREGGSAAAQPGGGASLERNALVAVFLRQLEYSQSIIFLTSNRAQMFDPAIKSRVHLSLYYPPPNMLTRRQLWEDKFNEAPAEKLHVELDRTKALSLVTRYPLNGREISNIFNSAMTLGTSDRDKKLKIEHLEAVLKVWEEASDNYLGRVKELRLILETIVDQALRGLGLLVLLGLAVIISLHGYQVVFKGTKDVIILYR